MKEYSWNVGFSYAVDANDVGQEFEKLGENLTAETVVNVARDENNILHNIFEWDDTVAGEKYRKIQASQLISNLKVVIKEDEEKPVITRAFVTTQRNTKFQPIEKVVNDVTQYQLLLEKAYRELNSIKCKYDSLIEIQELLADMPEVL